MPQTFVTECHSNISLYLLALSIEYRLYYYLLMIFENKCMAANAIFTDFQSQYIIPIKI